MKTFLLALLLFPFGLLAQDQGFVIRGKITGLKDSSQAFLVTTTDNTVIAKAPIVKGSFTLTGKIPEPSLYWIMLGDAQAQHIYLENSPIIITGSKTDIKNLQVVGSRSHLDFKAFQNTFTPLMSSLSSTATRINESQDERLKASLMPVYDSLRKRVNTEVGSFVATRRSSYVSPFLLQVTAQLLEDPIVLEERFKLLDAAIQQTSIGNGLAQYIAEGKIGAIGSEAIDFQQADTTGAPIALSSFKGKYVLLDFWASWCRPCRLENPNVVKAFKKFSPKNFTILSVSLDKEKAPWLQAIKADNLAWTNVSDLQYWNNAAAQLYKVQGIPQNFLIDPAGKIVGKNLRGEELESKLCELLGCN
jgi:peroxiredoxin